MPRPLRQNRRAKPCSVIEYLESRRMLTATPIWNPPQLIETDINEVIYTEGADITKNGLDDVLAAGPNVLFYASTRDGGFATPLELTDDGVGYGMTLARDVDKDGDLDVIASSSTKGIIVIKNNGDGSFGAEELISSFEGIQRIATADIDGDGDLDVVSGSYSGKRLAWHRNVGNGSFEADIVLNTDVEGLFSVAVADLNADGRPDIVTAEFGEDNAVAMYVNTPSGFDRTVISNDLNAPLAVEIADLDGDGDDDVIAGAYYGDNVVWYENDGNASFSQNSNSEVTDNVGGPFRIRAADWDNDLDLDLISVSTRDDKVAFHENLGGGNFAEQVVLFDNWSGPTAGSPADTDGDGDEDLIIASYADDSLLWVRNDTVRPDNRFKDQVVVSDQLSEVFVVDAVDLDGDGSRDLLAAVTGANQVSWAKNVGNGEFGSFQIIGTQTGSPLFAGAADLDGDGDNDVFTTSFGAANEISWYENLGEGVFSEQIIIDSELGVPRWLEAGDADGDGDLDLFAATNEDDRYIWYENRLDEESSDFVIGQVIHDGEGKGANKLIPVDMDDDGDLDALAASSTPSDETPISWYENDGAGNFSVQHIVADSTQSQWYARPADLDGDGDVDVVTSSFVGPLVWYENLDDGSFSAARVISDAAKSSYGLDVGDIDGDGDMDVVSGSYADNEIAWYENLGNGEFSGQQVISRAQSGPFSVILADLDGDGDEDVVAGSYYDDTVAWYENDPAKNEPELLPNIDKFVTTEHVDLSFNFRSGEWHASVDVDELDGSTQFYEPDEAVIFAGPTSRSVRPDDPLWDFMGVAPGDPIWVLPQERTAGIAFPGFAVDRTDNGTFARYFESDPRINSERDWLKFELVDMRGPEGGHFGVYSTIRAQTDPVVGAWMSTSDGVSSDDAFWQREGGHSHASFFFTEPGLYEVDLKASGFIDVNANRVFDPGLDVFSESEVSTFYFAVETPNAVPTIEIPNPVEIEVGSTLALRDEFQIRVVDEDPSSGNYEVTLEATGGVLSLVPEDVELTAGDGRNDALITLVGSLSALNDTLGTLEYRAVSGVNTDPSIHIEVKDRGFFHPDLDGNGISDNATIASAILRIDLLGDPIPRTVGDLDGDDTVNLADFTILKEAFGSDGEPLTGGDLDGDGLVDLADFAILKRNFGKTIEEIFGDLE